MGDEVFTWGFPIDAVFYTLLTGPVKKGSSSLDPLKAYLLRLAIRMRE